MGLGTLYICNSNNTNVVIAYFMLIPFKNIFKHHCLRSIKFYFLLGGHTRQCSNVTPISGIIPGNSQGQYRTNLGWLFTRHMSYSLYSSPLLSNFSKFLIVILKICILYHILKNSDNYRVDIVGIISLKPVLKAFPSLVSSMPCFYRRN